MIKENLGNTDLLKLLKTLISQSRNNETVRPEKVKKLVDVNAEKTLNHDNDIAKTNTI